MRGDETGVLTERSLFACGRFALFLVVVFGARFAFAFGARFAFAFGARRDLARLAGRFLVLDFLRFARAALRAIRWPQELSTTPPFTCSTCPLM